MGMHAKILAKCMVSTRVDTVWDTSSQQNGSQFLILEKVYMYLYNFRHIRMRHTWQAATHVCNHSEVGDKEVSHFT
jgi:hypothetical protein